MHTEKEAGSPLLSWSLAHAKAAAATGTGEGSKVVFKDALATFLKKRFNTFWDEIFSSDKLTLWKSN